jgi:putative toxin-antitoxin system antitoxin component (TIGR02293 family)
MAEPAAPLASSVGYAGYLGLRPAGPLDLVRHISRGLSFHAFEQLRAALDLPLADLAGLIGIPARTLHRRKEEGRLQPDESDRLVRLSRVWGRSVELFEGDAAEARHWLGSPRAALGGQTPLALSCTEVGAREVESLIGRLEHGVFS